MPAAIAEDHDNTTAGPTVLGPAVAGRTMSLDGLDDSGFQIGGYRVEATLGQGGMGEVFLAWDERLHRHVAIKRIRADLPIDQGRRLRFRREARAAARLCHPAIVQVFDILETDEGDCIVMERVEGRSLAEVIALGEVDLELALRLGAEIADGLAEAHSKGLVHRDLKPQNVMVTTPDRAHPGRAKVLDFGLARMLWNETGKRSTSAEESSALTRVGALVGTVHAMSPEQASGRTVDHRSDLFALGGLLYEMLTRRAPFRGANWLDTLRRVTSEEPEPLTALRPDLPADLTQLITRLLAKDPEARPQNARVVADALERLHSVVTVESAKALPAGRSPIPASVVAPADIQRLPTGEWPAPAPASDAKPNSVLRVLVFTDLIDSTKLIETLGDSRAADVSARHDRAARDLLAHFNGFEIDKSDGFLFLFERADDAVGYAMAYHQALERLSEEQDIGVQARVGVHLGQVLLRHNTPDDVSRGAKPLEVEGLAKPMAARVMSLAEGRQTLLTRGAFDLARRASVAGELASPEVHWLAHGTYVLKGVEEPLELFEVGLEGLAPLRKPADTDKVRRALAVGDELILGWRPAAGQAVPRRKNWTLEKRLGEGGFGEVWLASHKSGERRVFKFCFEAARLRALKREVTLFRLLKEALGHRDDIARILDWHFEAPPYFIESEYTEGGNLVDWATKQGGLGKVPFKERLNLATEVAEALNAAHSVGVLHKDVKPENVLITTGRDGQPRIRLADFGIGLLTERGRLEGQRITAMGFTQTMTPTESSDAGTLGYLAPELVEGKAATVQADVYSFGVLLYQLIVADFSRTLAPGWRRGVEDEILVEDIAHFVDGQPERRPTSIMDAAMRLRTLEQRRRAKADEEARQMLFERVQRRRRIAMEVAAIALVVLAVVAFMAVRENSARREAEERREQAENLISFMVADLRDKLHAMGRLDILNDIGDEAVRYFRSISRERLSRKELYHYNEALNQLALVRLDEGNLPAAHETYAEALELARELVGRDPRDVEWRMRLGAGHFYLGRIAWQQGNLNDAIDNFRIHYDLSRQLVDDHPNNPDIQLELANARNNIGFVQQARGELSAAGESLQFAYEILEQLLVQDPGNTELRLQFNDQTIALAKLLWQIGKVDTARSALEKSLMSAQALVAEEPSNTQWLAHLATTHNVFGQLLRALNVPDSAHVHFQKHLEYAQRLTNIEPQNTEWRRELAIGHAAVGNSLTHRGRLQDARAHLQKSLGVLNELTKSNLSPHLSLDRSRARHALGMILLKLGDRENARKQAETALALAEPLAEQEPGNIDFSLALGSGLLLRGKLEDRDKAAQEAWKRAALILENICRTSNNLEALGLWQEALELTGQQEKARLVRQRFDKLQQRSAGTTHQLFSQDFDSLLPITPSGAN